MTPLLVVLLVLLVLICLLLCPIYLIVTYNGSFAFKIRYLFLTFTLLPQKEKKKNKSKSDKKKQESKDKKEKKSFSLKENGGISGFIEIINKSAAEIKKIPSFINKHLKFTRLDINISVASDDAADTAVTYGKICAGVYPALGIILNIINCKSPAVSIYPDFDKTDIEINADVRAKISVLFTIISAIKGINIILKITRLLSGDKK